MSTGYIAVYLPANLFWIYTIYRYMGIFFNKSDAAKMQIYLTYFGFYAVSSTVNICFGIPVLNILVSLAGIFSVTLLYQAHFLKRLTAVFMIYIISMLCDILVTAFLNVRSTKIEGNIVTTILSYLFIFIIELVIEKYMQFRSGQMVRKGYIFMILGVPVSTMIILAVLIFFEYLQISVLILVSFLLLLINFLVMSMYDILLKEYEKRYQMQILEQQVSGYRKQIELLDHAQQRIEYLRHDMKHHLMAVTKLMEAGKTDKMRDYLDKLLQNTENPKPYIMSGNAELDSILNYMIQKAVEKGIRVQSDIKIATDMKADSFDLNVILGNLMDNAIEAAECSEEKYIKITMEYQKNLLFLAIENSYQGEVLSEKGQLLSTKQDRKNHGFGLKSVEQMVKKYHGEMDVQYKNHIFEVKLILYLE